MEYTFSSGAKKFIIALIVAGIAFLGLGLLLDGHHTYIDKDLSLGQRIWTDLLGNGFFFFGISLGALFFLALQYAAEAAYTIVYKRVLEAVTKWLPIGLGIIVIVILAGMAHQHHIYHWMDPKVYQEFLPDGKTVNPDYDHIIAHKSNYFNFGDGDGYVHLIRVVAFGLIFVYFMSKFRKNSLLEDEEGGTRIHFKNITSAAIFLVLFGYGSSILAWDLLMSTDVHWFSTLYGWYVFAGFWLSSIITTIVLIVYLQSTGKMAWVKKGHLHDLSKWMFALSFLWTYLWFAQFMLIWYADIPEEVAPYVARIQDYKVLFFGMMLINFVLPMVGLMDADAKKKKGLITVIGCIIFITHWIDVQLLIIPSSMKGEGQIGLVEFGFFFIFLGAFLLVTLKALAGRPLLVKNHPYLEESKNLYH